MGFTEDERRDLSRQALEQIDQQQAIAALSNEAADTISYALLQEYLAHITRVTKLITRSDEIFKNVRSTRTRHAGSASNFEYMTVPIIVGESAGITTAVQIKLYTQRPNIFRPETPQRMIAEEVFIDSDGNIMQAGEATLYCKGPESNFLDKTTEGIGIEHPGLTFIDTCMSAAETSLGITVPSES